MRIKEWSQEMNLLDCICQTLWRAMTNLWKPVSRKINALWFEDEIMLLLSVRVNGKDCYNFSEVNHARSY